MKDFESLVGRKVMALLVSKDQGDLVYVCDDGTFHLWETVGDCCSESWFADVVGTHALFGREVISVDEVPLPEWVNVDDGRTRQESDAAYGYRITTDGGQCDIIFRNSSNGYYGGWARFLEVPVAPTDYIEIRDDWSAQ